ncbi:DUF424 family protein [Candidatus Micrarchaeota archaeon]|nr:DUF424 family protein [Candidatus Micrarchaeota archaeon]
MYAKVHERMSAGRVVSVVAVCDQELVGKVLKQGSIALDLKTYKNFYCGELVEEQQAIELIKEADSLNLVGEKALKAVAKAIGVDVKAAKKISGVPHLQVYRI